MTRKITYFATTVPHLEDCDWRELEGTGLQKEPVLAALNDYLRDYTVFQKAPTEKEVRDRLESIETRARQLAKLVGDPTEESQAALRLCFPFYRSDPTALAHILYELASNSKAASQDLQGGQGGAPGDPHLKQLIRKLHTMFVENGGPTVKASWNEIDEECQGEFVFIVKEVLKLGGIPYHSEGSLYQSIRRAVKDPSRKSHA